MMTQCPWSLSTPWHCTLQTCTQIQRRPSLPSHQRPSVVGHSSCLAVGFTSLGCVRISQDDMWKQLLGVAELGYVGFIGMLWLEELRFSGVGVYMTDTYNHKDVTAYFKEADYKLKQVSPSKLMQVCVCVRLWEPPTSGTNAFVFFFVVLSSCPGVGTHRRRRNW